MPEWDFWGLLKDMSDIPKALALDLMEKFKKLYPYNLYNETNHCFLIDGQLMNFNYLEVKKVAGYDR